ncbi:hypothetical protein RRG08_020752 [Elysia crispata]|uniref:Uncharacterized protein n=1 Tax=Elysia crispata TaxID=231223 RepID=A0AAE1AU05_9GAST|nr:hypothetical protein RRG08_020752 [Elysia crispata]
MKKIVFNLRCQDHFSFPLRQKSWLAICRPTARSSDTRHCSLPHWLPEIPEDVRYGKTPHRAPPSTTEHQQLGQGQTITPTVQICSDRMSLNVGAQRLGARRASSYYVIAASRKTFDISLGRY